MLPAAHRALSALLQRVPAVTASSTLPTRSLVRSSLSVSPAARYNHRKFSTSLSRTMAGSTHQDITLPGGQKFSVPTGLFINNEFVASSNAETFETRNPATDEFLLNFSHGTEEDVNTAVKAARKAFKTTWGLNIPATDRAALIFKLADLIERDSEKLALLESVNSGKGVRIARESDVADSVGCLRYYAGLADKHHGQTINSYGKDKIIYTLHQPIGVCGQIIPWNYPLLMWAWKVGPALASGCTIVMKPSELTPLTALVLSELIVEAGFPPGVVNTVPGLGRTTGAAIAGHMDIDKIAFTGSVVTGRAIAKAAADSNLKKVTLELGGKSPVLVFDSANLEETAAWVALGIWFNSGQDCCAGSRIYIQDSIYDKFLEVLKAKAEACAIGLPSDEKTSFGPLISALQRDKVLNYIKSGKEEGAKLITGGGKWSGSENGYYVQPTILSDVKAEMKVVKEEIFGPVIVAAKFSSEEEGIELANDTTYGLGAAVFTNDHRQAMRVTAAIDAGTVWCNQYALLHTGAPFGGFKMSGVGRELGTYGLEAYMQIKAVHHNLDSTMEWPI